MEAAGLLCSGCESVVLVAPPRDGRQRAMLANQPTVKPQSGADHLTVKDMWLELVEHSRWKQSLEAHVNWKGRSTPSRRAELHANPRSVYICYSWDSLSHRQWVANLAEYMRSRGVPVVLDEFEKLADPADVLTNGLHCHALLFVVTPLFIETCLPRGRMYGSWGHDEFDILARNIGRFDKALTLLRSGDRCMSGFPILDCRSHLPDWQSFESVYSTLRAEWRMVMIGGLGRDELFAIYESTGDKLLLRLAPAGDPDIPSYANSVRLFSALDGVPHFGPNDEEAFREALAELPPEPMESFEVFDGEDEIFQALAADMPPVIGLNEVSISPTGEERSRQEMELLFGRSIARQAQIRRSLRPVSRLQGGSASRVRDCWQAIVNALMRLLP